MADMFGSPIGQAHGIESQLGLAKLAMAPDEARLTRAKANVAEMQAESQKRFAEAMQGSQNQSLWGAAEAALKAGLPTAYHFANAASNMEYRRAATRTQEMRGLEAGVRAQTADLDLRARSLTGVTNLQGLQAAFRDYESQAGRRSGYLDDQGNLLPNITDDDVPVIVGRERAKALSTKDQLMQDFRGRQLSSQEKERASKQQSRDFWQDMDNQYAREASRQKARAERGGSTGLFPSNAQISVGSDYLSEKFGVDSKEPWTRVMGRELVDTAKRLRSQNSGLSASEAIDEAFKQLDRKGAFGAHRLVNKKDDLTRPMALPYKDGKPDPEKLKAGQLYTDDSGATREWSGKGWSTPTRKISPAAAGADISLSNEDARVALGIDETDDEDSADDGEED